MAGFPQWMTMGGGAQMMPQGGAMGAGAGMNPFLEGLLATVAGQNPEVVANAAASAGIPPPSPDAMGDPMGTLGGFITPSAGAPATLDGWGATVTPNPQGNPMQQMDPSMLKNMGGFKMPGQDNKPIMNAGVSGAQQAPVVGASGGMQSSQMMNQLIQQLMARQGGPAVPTLGAMIGG